MSAILRTSPRGDLAVLLARIGIAFPFIYAGYGKVFGPARAGMTNMFSMMMNMPKPAADSLTLTIGALEIISGVFVIIGLLTRLAALYQIVILLGSIFVLARLDIGNPNLPAVWKDPGLLLVAIAILIRGSGKYGVDSRLVKQS